MLGSDWGITVGGGRPCCGLGRSPVGGGRADVGVPCNAGD